MCVCVHVCAHMRAHEHVPPQGVRYSRRLQSVRPLFAHDAPLQGVRDLTAQEDLQVHLRQQLLLQLAREKGCSKIARGDCAGTVAVHVLAETAKVCACTYYVCIIMCMRACLCVSAHMLMRPFLHVFVIMTHLGWLRSSLYSRSRA